ncbi:MAG: PIN domain-containing protein [Planctomycetes bacterium]|nr:PIN domain-containing protein [Planctomycetota bacterium]
MKIVFADTLYWLAIVIPRDQWREPAKRAKAALRAAILVTTDEVLAEFLNMLSGRGHRLRQAGVKMVRAIMDNPNVRVIAQSRDSFLRALDLYKAREDKGYSLTDCSSMNTMKQEGVEEILTNDDHVEKEGFVVLIKK